ncbi:hypothetical protein L7F22_002418 [Adiantum nelumboides]|nr:hypothetical protein [Adiantum nelumboides]
MQDVLVQKKQKLPIVYATRAEEMTMTQFQWEELDELCRSTIRLHLAESVYFSVLKCESAYALWQKLCNTYAKDTASNKVFMMRKLFNLRMKESASVASHINDFDSLFAQIRAQRINIDDEMKAIFLLCSLHPLGISFALLLVIQLLMEAQQPQDPYSSHQEESNPPVKPRTRSTHLTNLSKNCLPTILGAQEGILKDLPEDQESRNPEFQERKTTRRCSLGNQEREGEEGMPRYKKEAIQGSIPGDQEEVEEERNSGSQERTAIQEGKEEKGTPEF